MYAVYLHVFSDGCGYKRVKVYTKILTKVLRGINSYTISRSGRRYRN